MVTFDRKRRTADERRDDVIQAAIGEFALFGYHGGSTQRIATEAGISQHYVLRLFGTKKALFIAAVDRVCNDIVEMWRGVFRDYLENLEGPASAEGGLTALREPYSRLVRDVKGLRLVLQATAAAADEDIRTHLKGHMEFMFDWIRQATGAPYDDVRAFWSQGMTLTVAASIGAMADVEHSEWARAMMMMPSTSLQQEIHAVVNSSDALD